MYPGAALPPFTKSDRRCYYVGQEGDHACFLGERSTMYDAYPYHTTSGMDAHLYYIVGLSMLDAEDRNTYVYVCD